MQQPLQKGVSLVELMLGLSLSVILILFLSHSFIAASQSAQQSHAVQQLQTTALYASTLLTYHIRLTGYQGHTLRRSKLIGTATPNTLYNCDRADWTRQIDYPLTASNQNQPPYPCLTRNQLQGDTITTRYTSPLITNKFASQSLYTRASLTKVAFFLGKDRHRPENNVAAPFENRKFISNTFYVSQSKQQWCDHHASPALAMLSRSSTGRLRRTLIVAGIEQLQIQYSTDFKNYLNADQIADWKTIKSTKVWLLVRTLCQYHKRPKKNTFQLADIQSHFNDRFYRKLFWFKVTLRNRL